MSDFNHFPKQTFQFLAKLEKNNNRDWFKENKSNFEKQVMEPAVKFVEDFGEHLAKTFPDIRYDTSRNGSGSMFRIYKDTRFSKDKTPYKTNLGFVFWVGEGSKKENPAFYIHISAKETQIYAGQYWMSKFQIERYRQAVDDKKTGAEFDKVVANLRKSGINMIGGEHYKRVPKGYSADHPRANWLKHTGFYVGMPAFNAKQSLNSDWVGSVLNQCKSMKEIINWLQKNAK